MEPKIKVVTKKLRGWFATYLDENAVATEIEEQEKLGWQLVTSYGIATPSFIGQGITDTLVFIYRKK